LIDEGGGRKMEKMETLLTQWKAAQRALIGLPREQKVQGDLQSKVLTKEQAYQRWVIGLSNRDFRILDSLEEKSCSCSGACSCSFEDNDVKSLREAACKHPSMSESQDWQIDILQLCPDSAHLFDSKRNCYAKLEFKTDSSGKPEITAVKTITPEDMVKQQSGLLHEVLRENLMQSAKEGVGTKFLRRKLFKISEHLAVHEKGLLLG
jgi:hypothetical protein